MIGASKKVVMAAFVASGVHANQEAAQAVAAQQNGNHREFAQQRADAAADLAAEAIAAQAAAPELKRDAADLACYEFGYDDWDGCIEVGLACMNGSSYWNNSANNCLMRNHRHWNASVRREVCETKYQNDGVNGVKYGDFGFEVCQIAEAKCIEKNTAWWDYYDRDDGLGHAKCVEDCMYWWDKELGANYWWDDMANPRDPICKSKNLMKNEYNNKMDEKCGYWVVEGYVYDAEGYEYAYGHYSSSDSATSHEDCCLHYSNGWWWWYGTWGDISWDYDTLPDWNYCFY